MRFKFSLPLKPFSINKMHYRDMSAKTADFRDWERSAVACFADKGTQAVLAKARDAFDPAKHVWSIEFRFKFPAEKLFNKQGLVSSRSEDLSNIEKPLLDLLCLPKYHVQGAPYGVPNLNIDDKYVFRMVSTKSISPNGKYSIDVILRPMTRK